MLRKTTVLGTTAFVLAGLISAVAPSAAIEPGGQPRDEERYVNMNNVDPANPKSFADVKPDSVSNGPNGTRIELYTSMGDLEGSMDWRTVNLFSYLVNSVPAGKHSYTTLFNSLYDGRGVSYNSSTKQWKASTPSEVYAPTAAYINLLNKNAPAGGPDRRAELIDVLGGKESMDEAYAANSSLARVVMHSSNRGSNSDNSVYIECKYGSGGCLSAPYSSSNLMHSKYGVFEQAADSDGNIRDHAYFITSSNLNGSSGSKKSNTSIVVYGDELGYNNLVEIFESKVDARNTKYDAGDKMRQVYLDAISLGGNGVIKGAPTDSGTVLIPSPRTKNAKSSTNQTLINRTDAEAKFLLDQANGGDGSSAMPGCRAYVIHSLFNSTRGGVFDALAKLDRRSCDVRVILGTNAISDVVDGYFSMSTDLRQVVDRVEFANVHDKSISYKFGPTSTFFGGSTNLTGTSLDYDELAFRIDDPTTVDAKLRHDERVYSAARGRTKWANPSSVSVSPSSVTVKTGETVQLTPKVSPSNALVTKTQWQSSDPSIAAVDPWSGKVTGVSDGTAVITVSVESPNLTAPKTATRTVTVSATATSSNDSVRTVNVAPTLSMERYQGPPSSTETGTTDVVVSWGGPGEDYSGNAVLQYYSKGWRNYRTINVTKGRGTEQIRPGSSKAWRVVGTSISGIYNSETGARISGGDPASGLVSSGYSYLTVRTRAHSTSLRLYATSMAKAGKIPFGISWQRSGSVRLQYKSGSRWKTYKSYSRSPDWDMVLGVASSTRYWRVVGSNGQVSNSVKVAIR